jgi:hypothetical protein
VIVKDSSGATATATCTVMISCLSTAPTYGGTMTADYLIVGGQTIGYGYSQFGGSITPTTDSNSNTVSALWTYTSNGVSGNLTLVISSASILTQSYFTNLSINGANYTSASAGYFNYSSGAGTWRWTFAPGFTPADTYTVVYQ